MISGLSKVGSTKFGESGIQECLKKLYKILFLVDNFPDFRGKDSYFPPNKFLATKIITI